MKIRLVFLPIREMIVNGWVHHRALCLLSGVSSSEVALHEVFYTVRMDAPVMTLHKHIKKIHNHMDVNQIKGIYNPQYLPNDFFALSTFLDDLKPSHLNLSIQICPKTRDWISLSTAKHRPVFCCCFFAHSRTPEVHEDTPISRANFRRWGCRTTIRLSAQFVQNTRFIHFG